jgi:hypothetical protein
MDLERKNIVAEMTHIHDRKRYFVETMNLQNQLDMAALESSETFDAALGVAGRIFVLNQSEK